MQYIRHFFVPPFSGKRRGCSFPDSPLVQEAFSADQGGAGRKKMSDHSLIRTCQAVVYAAPVSDKCCNYWPARRRERDTSLPATEFPFQFFPIYPPYPTTPPPPLPLFSCTATHHVISTKIIRGGGNRVPSAEHLMTITLDGINLITKGIDLSRSMHRC